MKIVQIITLVQCRIFSLLLINIKDYMTVHCKVSSDVEKAAIQCNTVVVRDRNLIYTVCAVCICKTANPEMLWFTTCACTSKFHSCIAMQKLS